MLGDEFAPRHSRPQAPLGSDYSRHCGISRLTVEGERPSNLAIDRAD
jgi:hypothetical protein